MDLDLEGKVAIVTGGSGGIGRGLVSRLAAEGCRVVVATRDEVKGQEVVEAARGKKGEAVLLPTDVTDREAVGPRPAGGTALGAMPAVGSSNMNTSGSSASISATSSLR